MEIVKASPFLQAVGAAVVATGVAGVAVAATGVGVEGAATGAGVEVAVPEAGVEVAVKGAAVEVAATGAVGVVALVEEDAADTRLRAMTIAAGRNHRSLPRAKRRAQTPLKLPSRSTCPCHLQP